jgi:large subunit ribosomal protein L25
MEQIALKAQLRDNKGNGSRGSKHLREQGIVPAVVYHRGEGTVNIVVPEKEITRIIHAAAGENILINLTIEKDKKTKPRAVIIKEVQHHPVKRNILHVDFNEISMNEKLTVDVEIIAQGDPIGVKQDGGSLEHTLREIKIQCLPADIPKHIDVDVSGLKLNQGIHVRDLKVSDKIKILTDPDTLLLIVKHHEEKVEEEAAAPAEVEVIREKKEEEGAAKPGEKAAEAKPKEGEKK